MFRSRYVIAFFVSWPCAATLALAQKTPDLRLDVGDPPGAAVSWDPVIAATGTSVFAAWMDERSGGEHVFFNRSLNGGRRWLESALRLDESVGVELGNVGIAAEGSSVYVAWNDDRSGDLDIYFDRSLDGGSTWLPADVRLDLGDLPGEHSSAGPVVVAQGSSVYVAWVDARGPVDLQIYLNRSLDRGATWLPAAVRVSLGPLSAIHGANYLRMAAASSAIHVVWAEDLGMGEEGEIRYNRSEDEGLTWLPSFVRIDHNPGEFAGYPRLAVSESAVYVVWYDQRDGEDLYLNRSLDGGLSWLPDDVRLETGPGANFFSDHRIACSDTALHVVWQFSGIQYQRSLDQGATWLSAPTRLDPGAVGDAGRPEIAVEEELVQVVWRGGEDVFTNRSLDEGSSWLAVPARLDLGSAPGAGASYNPRIARSGSSSYVTWYDNRDGEFDIYFNLALGYQTYGQGKAGSGGIVPALAGGGSASVGGTAVLDLTGGLGGAQAVLITSVDGPATISTSLGLFLVLPPWDLQAVSLGGASGAPGAGAASVLVPIPPDPGLIGLRVNFQAGVLDPGITPSISLTQGLELWIL